MKKLMINKKKILLLFTIFTIFLTGNKNFATGFSPEQLKQIEKEEEQIRKEKQQKQPTKEQIVKDEEKEKSEKAKKEEKDTLKSRQFITLEAETGKEFVLVVDYYTNKKEVRFLTELNEDDLKNIIKVQNQDGNLKKIKEEEQKTKDKKEKDENKNKEKETKKEEPKIKKQQKKSNKLMFLPIICIMAAGLYFGYLKFFKKK